jgi:hypothetical protein
MKEYNLYLRDEGIVPAFKNIFNCAATYTKISFISDKNWPLNHDRITDKYTIEQIRKMNSCFKNKKQFINKNN